MTSPAPTGPAVAALLSELVDDAGLFPPASLSVPDAVDGHLAARRGDFGWMLGRFVCPAAKVPDLPPALRLCVVAAGIAEVREAAAAGTVEAVELRPVDGAVRDAAVELAAVARELGVTAFVEVPATGDAVASVAGTGVGAKLRCGGVTSDAFPPPEALAEAVTAAARRGVHLKATAGLHHPVRRYDAQVSVPMHGFLNLAAAVVAADAGAGIAEVEKVMREEDAAAFVADDDGFGSGARYVADAATMRRLRQTRFAGFGSCSFVEPVEDLVALGLVAPGTVLAV